MKLMTLWGVRAGFEDGMPELMDAWDEFSVDQWPEGWEEACGRARASWGEELVSWRVIELDVSAAAVGAAFAPHRVAAVVSGSAPTSTEDPR